MKSLINGLPYIPGSSLKGALRACLERAGKKDGTPYELDTNAEIRIHKCKDPKCPVCNIFGLPAEDAQFPTRLIVRDAILEGPPKLKDLETLELPYTEVKTEVVIDRITSKTMPRHIERVPPGAWFKFEMIFNVYQAKDIEFLKDLFNAMRLLEDHYLGGHGSRGSGKIKFGKWEIEKGMSEPEEKIKIKWKWVEEYMGEKKEDDLQDKEAEFLPEDWEKEEKLNEILQGIEDRLSKEEQKKQDTSSDDKNLQT